MDQLAMMGGSVQPFDPSLRGKLLVSDMDAIRKIQNLYSVLLRAFVGMTLLSLFVAVPYIEYGITPLIFSLGSVLLTLNLYRWFVNVMRFDTLRPGVYENGVQLAGNLFLPYAEISEVFVRSVPLIRSKEVLYIKHRDSPLLWKFPMEIIGRRGLEMIEKSIHLTA